MSRATHVPVRRRVLGEALLHPLAVGALVTLLVNDQLLKRVWPGVMTGKLSDFAGMLLFPLLAFALAELALAPFGVPLERAGVRRGLILACAALTAVAFAAIKTWEPATEIFRTLLGAARCASHLFTADAFAPCRVRCVRDPTDLVALPCVLAPVWLVAPLQLKSSPTSTPSVTTSKKSLKY